MKKLIILANYDISDTGMSGGTRILIEMLKDWGEKLEVFIYADERTVNLLHKNGVKKAFIKIITPKKEFKKDLYVY